MIDRIEIPIKRNNKWQVKLINYVVACVKKVKNEIKTLTKYILCEGGLGSGKSHIAAYIFIFLMVVFPGNLGLAGAATYPAVRDVVIPQILKILPAALIREYRLSHPQVIILINGSEIRFRQLDKAAKVKGPEYGAIYVEEASNINLSVLHMLIARLRQPGIPLRVAIFATNPEDYSKIADIFDAQKDNDNYIYFHSETKDNTANLADDYEKNQRMVLSPRLQKKYLDGIRIKSLGIAFPEFNKKLHAWGPDNVLGIRGPPESFNYVIGGGDNGYANPGSLVVLGVKDKRYYLLDMVYRAGKREGWWVEEAVQLNEKYGVSSWWIDSADPDRIDAYIEAGMDAKPAVKDKGSVQNRLGRFGQLLHVRPDINEPLFNYNPETCEDFEEEVIGLRKKEKPGTEDEYLEEIRKTCPNHAIDAVTYAIYGDWKEQVDWKEAEAYKPEGTTRDMVDTYLAGSGNMGKSKYLGGLV